eukprot:10341409-Ditylum_brightwellii.AAC.1
MPCDTAFSTFCTANVVCEGVSRRVELQTTSSGHSEKDPAGHDFTEIISATSWPEVTCSLASREHSSINNLIL